MKTTSNQAHQGPSSMGIRTRRKIRDRLKNAWIKVLPSPLTRAGAAIGILFFLGLFMVLFGLYLRPGLPRIFDSLAGILFYAVIIFLLGLGTAVVLKLLAVLPGFINKIGLVSLILLIVFFLKEGWPLPISLGIGLIFGLAGACLGSGLASLFSKTLRQVPPAKKVFVYFKILSPLALVILCILWLASKGSDRHLTEFREEAVQFAALSVPDPSLPGPFRVGKLTYGIGADKHRPEFGQKAELKTESVDATPFIKNNKGWKMKVRHWYWGFDFKKFPLNGRVWYPEGEGPFPLVLIVHGNHKMQEFSDPGYGYLGELMASRGFIFVSVDENFFNGSWPAGLSRENDGRGWLLLQHLRVWKKWNGEESNPFFSKVDMNNIALAGHSRGGEAAAIAGAFNHLSHYPDDATVLFDFNFSIRAIISIAPSDQQYKPAGKPTPLENINYLVLQGAHDADCSFFMGERQFNRVRFTDGNYWFKASLYSYRSNHGQFNAVWGDNDWGMPMGTFLNRKALIDGEAQRKISKVYISAFLEATLHNDRSYVPLFQDAQVIAAWLPKDIYINRFEDSTFRPVCTFEEDVDVTTTTSPGGRTFGKNLAVWREADLEMRKSGTKENNAVFLGWRGPESDRQGDKAPSYRVELTEDSRESLKLRANSRLVFSLADADEKIPDPEDEKGQDKGQDQERSKKDAAKKAEEKKAKKEAADQHKEPLRLSVELVASDGTSARLPLDRFRSVPPVVRSRFTKLPKEKFMMGKDYEPTMQTFELPLAVFAELYPEFNPGLLKDIRFVFDQGREGVIILDNVGFAGETK